MKYMYKIILVMIVLLKYLCMHPLYATMLNSISVTNKARQAVVMLDCTTVPVYVIFILHNPERVVIDLLKTSKVRENISPIHFNGSNLVQCIRTNISTNHQSARIVLDLICPVNIEAVTQKKVQNNYCITLTILKKATCIIPSINTCKTPVIMHNKDDLNAIKIRNNKKRIVDVQFSSRKNQENTQYLPIIVAIDAGHGGQDPGATGRHGIYEKHITINIAKKLKMLLDSDPRFKSVMIRDGDYFLSVMERSNIARKRKANVLISIHADSALNASVKGASVWVLSNRRAQSEMMHWLQCREKHSELLGGLGEILTNYRSDPYFNHLVLDLQFGYAQRVGYDIAVHVLSQLKNITLLHKENPEYSSFGVLRSPDIPSILVETGFISNVKEEYLLASNGYQLKIASALYKGLCTYFTDLKKQQLGNTQTAKNYITAS